VFHKGEHKQRFTCEVHTACVKNGYTLEAVMIPVNVLDRRRMRRGDSSPALTAPSSRMGHGPGRTDTAKLNYLKSAEQSHENPMNFRGFGASAHFQCFSFWGCIQNPTGAQHSGSGWERSRSKISAL
jgi:hypothetical protein